MLVRHAQLHVLLDSSTATGQRVHIELVDDEGDGDNENQNQVVESKVPVWFTLPSEALSMMGSRDDRVVISDIEPRNGLIHVIDGLIGP